MDCLCIAWIADNDHLSWADVIYKVLALWYVVIAQENGLQEWYLKTTPWTKSQKNFKS